MYEAVTLPSWTTWKMLLSLLGKIKRRHEVKQKNKMEFVAGKWAEEPEHVALTINTGLPDVPTDTSASPLLHAHVSVQQLLVPSSRLLDFRKRQHAFNVSMLWKRCSVSLDPNRLWKRCKQAYSERSSWRIDRYVDGCFASSKCGETLDTLVPVQLRLWLWSYMISWNLICDSKMPWRGGWSAEERVSIKMALMAIIFFCFFAIWLGLK